jgi:hypothetical protein
MHWCGATTRSGAACRARPMLNGRCRKHGGTNPGRPVIHGRYSLTHRAALAEKVQRFLEDPQPGDLTAELALMRALLQDYLDRYADGVSLPAKEIGRIYELIEAIGRLVERIARIFNQPALTQAELQLLQARLSDLLVKYVDDPTKRLDLLDELAATLDGDRAGPRARLTVDATA